MVSLEKSVPNAAINQNPDTYSVLSTLAFFQDQVVETSQANVRAWIQTMALEPSCFSNLLIEELIKAHICGLDVRVVHDAYSDFVTANTFNHLPFLMSKANRQQKRVILKERAQFIEHINEQLPVTKTNIPRGPISHTPFPGVMGRDHKKISVIDDFGYLGGVNFTPLDEKRIDFMLKTNNFSIVQELARIFERSFYDETACDMVIPCDINNTIIVDKGQRQHSVIMEHAYELIEKESTKITVVSPYVPSGKFCQALNRAVGRDVQVELLTSGSEHLGKTQLVSQLVHGLGQKKPLFDTYHCPGIVHAKILLFSDHTAIIGSHNFDELFVQLGTEEISLLTHQPEILKQLQQYIANMR